MIGNNKKNNNLKLSNKIFKYIIITILLLLLCIILLLLWIFFYTSNSSYQAVLIDFKPSNFEVKFNNCFFYFYGDDLYYSKDGILDFKSQKILQTNQIQKINKDLIKISPNKQFIALIDNNQKINIINSEGKIISKFDTFIKSKLIKNKSIDYYQNIYFWNRNSDNLYYLKLDSNSKSRDEYSNVSLYKYSINSKLISKIHDFEFYIDGNFLISNDENKIVYQSNNSLEKNSILVQIDLITNKETIIENLSLTSFLINNNEFTKYSNLKQKNKSEKYFESNIQNKIVDYNNKTYLSDFYNSGKIYGTLDLVYKNNQTQILKGKYGWNAFKTIHTDFYYGNGKFIYGERYFLCNINSETFEGQILIDTYTCKYMKLPLNLDFLLNKSD